MFRQFAFNVLFIFKAVDASFILSYLSAVEILRVDQERSQKIIFRMKYIIAF